MFVQDETPLCVLNRAYLDDKESETYDLIEGAFRDNTEHVGLDFVLNATSMNRVARALQCDCHDYYKLDRGKHITWREGRSGMNVKINYSQGPERTSEIEGVLDASVGRIVKMCTDNCRTDFEKELFVHNYLADTVTYTDETHIDDMTEHTCVGALLEGKAVCEGIAKAASLILNKVGVDCGCVVNDTHMWNVVRLDGECYNLDITWDLRTEHRTMDYFNVEDRLVMSTHNCEYGPVCDGKKYNWYRYNGLVFHDLEGIYEAVMRGIERETPYLGIMYEGLDDGLVKSTVWQAFRDSGTRHSYSTRQYGMRNTFHIRMEE